MSSRIRYLPRPLPPQTRRLLAVANFEDPADRLELADAYEEAGRLRDAERLRALRLPVRLARNRNVVVWDRFSELPWFAKADWLEDAVDDEARLAELADALLALPDPNRGWGFRHSFWVTKDPADDYYETAFREYERIPEFTSRSDDGCRFWVVKIHPPEHEPGFRPFPGAIELTHGCAARIQTRYPAVVSWTKRGGKTGAGEYRRRTIRNEAAPPYLSFRFLVDVVVRDIRQRRWNDRSVEPIDARILARYTD